MTDFTSSLYLGMKHSSAELNGWEQLTTGVPAVLNEPPASLQVSKHAAHMQGLEAGVSAPSTLHLYSDLFELLSKKQIVLFIDEKIYPVSRYGIEKLSAHRIQVQPFRHFDAMHLDRLVRTKINSSVMPVVMSDGWCPLCGKVAPVKDYIDIVRPLRGNIIIDDTQAFGILGERSHNATPYGIGGGGTLKWLNIYDDSIVTVTSLAKAFGVPMAIMSGTSGFILAFKEASKTRVHSSPVSLVHLQAALNAFRINYHKGDQLRSRLWQNVCLLKNKLKESGIQQGGGIFPVQNISCRSRHETIKLFDRLKKNMIRTILISQHDGRLPVISSIIRCDHTTRDIAALANLVGKEIPYVESR